MESVIKWRTGEPKDLCEYIVMLEDGEIRLDSWMSGGFGWCFNSIEEVIAWCPLNEIKPYKE